MTTSYHQQADGLAESANKMVMIMVRQHLEPLAKHWPDLLQGHVMAYNTSKQASTGYEPFYLMHGFHAATVVEIVLPSPIAITGDEPVKESHDQALKKLAESQQRQKKAYDMRHKDVTYSRGLGLDRRSYTPSRVNCQTPTAL